MIKTLNTALVGCFLVIGYDVIGSILSRMFGFNYGWLMFGSIAIYAIVGLIASKRFFGGGILAAASVGFFDSTMGWYLSWMIDPVTSLEELTIFTIIFTIPFVTVLAALTGFLGAVTGRWLSSK